MTVKEPVSGPGRVSMDPDPRIPSRGQLRPDSLPPDPRRPFAHQLEAWARLDEANAAWSAGGSLKGLVAMPTAGGKTYTMINWLLMRVVNEGGRVVWLAQNDRLLEQAAVELRRSAARARDRTEIAFRIVSGGRCGADEIRQDDDFVLASVASLARHGGTFRRLFASRRCFAVLDEAHHAPAPSSRGLLESLPEDGRLVGLTGTPTRTDPHERPLLARLFKDGILYRAEAEVLIERGILARPIPVLVRSVVDRDVQPVRSNPPSHRRSRQLTGAALGRIAVDERHNAAVVQHFLAYRHVYGPTVVFLNSVRQAALLADRMRQAGIRADYIAGRRLDGGDNGAILGRFRNPAGGLDVLVNAQMLSEGVDVPRARTVIVAGPTGSEIRLRQMFGRALRGPAVGGGDSAFLVVMEDAVGRIPSTRSPFDLVPDLAKDLVVVGRDPHREGREEPPWNVIRTAARSFRMGAPLVRTEARQAHPARWYVLLPGGKHGPGRFVAAYDNEVTGWEAAIEHLAQLDDAGLQTIDGAMLLEEFFPGFDWPRPTVRDLDLLLDHARQEGGQPTRYGTEDRRACDPRVLAGLICEEDYQVQAVQGLLEGRYNPLARSIYPTFDQFRTAVFDELGPLLAHRAVHRPAPTRAGSRDRASRRERRRSVAG